MSANTFTFLSTVNAEKSLKDTPVGSASSVVADAGNGHIDLSNPEALPKRALNLLERGPMAKEQLRQELQPFVAEPLDPAFFDAVIEYLVKSEMVSEDAIGHLDLTSFAKQALSVFSVS